MENPGFLKDKYNLHNAPEIESAAKRTEVRTGEKVPQNPNDQIQNYLDRFKEIVERKVSEKPRRGMEALKKILYDKFVIKPEEIPEAYFEGQRRIAREQGHGDIETTQEMREQLSEVIVTDQRTSLDNWINYLASSDATYPDWLKYYAIRSVLGMGEYDKTKKVFTKRSSGTTKPFPDLNREALAYVLDAIEKKSQGASVDIADLETADATQFEKLLEGGNFAKLYAWGIEKATPDSQETLTNTNGHWVKYDRGSDYMPLVKSLQGHGTGWCTAGESTAEKQLQAGDFYVYYSDDQKGDPTIPRAAIRMQGQNIGEVRGVAPEQNLDPYISDVVQEKLKEFPDSAQYEKKAYDMKTLTRVEQKIKAGSELTKEELAFLYEIDNSIEGFGYKRDPRIEELLNTRNFEEDMPIVFGCEKSQIANYAFELQEGDKAYVGSLEPGVFAAIQKYHIEYVYTSFPKGKIQKEAIEIGGNDSAILLEQLHKQGIRINDFVRGVMEDDDFITLGRKEAADFIRLRIKDLFSDDENHTTQEIYNRAEELGLELCPAETGVYYRQRYSAQPSSDEGAVGVRLGMHPIPNSSGDFRVFSFDRDWSGLQLNDSWANPGDEWFPEHEIVFRLRKPEHSELKEEN